VKHFVAVLALLMGLPATILAADEPAVTVELNKLEARGGACRAYLVLENGAGVAFESLRLDLVMFDGEGIVARRLAVETAPLAEGKTSLKVFDIDGLACAEVGRVLLNDVMACSDASGRREDCLGLVEVESRADVDLVR